MTDNKQMQENYLAQLKALNELAIKRKQEEELANGRQKLTSVLGCLLTKKKNVLKSRRLHKTNQAQPASIKDCFLQNAENNPEMDARNAILTKRIEIKSHMR